MVAINVKKGMLLDIDGYVCLVSAVTEGYIHYVKVYNLEGENLDIGGVDMIEKIHVRNIKKFKGDIFIIKG